MSAVPIPIQRETSSWLWPDAAAAVAETDGRYFVTGSTDEQAIRDRALHALRREGYCGFGDVTVISV
ncbi:hypothetical protein JL39_21975 [Rhizobium sp. YS-1r]|nr:hypothetical protein JL39_21975 [Rhizobium sp. YS-1r]